MPASTRRAIGAVFAAIGVVLLFVGAWMVVKLGPSGEASFSATSKAPGAVVVPSKVLNAVDVPVRVKATRGDGGPVRLSVAPSGDARAILGTTAVSTVKAVHYPAATIDLQASGSGALADVSSADVWRLATKGTRSAELVVEQSGSPAGDPASNPNADPSNGPETAVVTSGDATGLSDVTLTLTWASQTWFFQALAVAVGGGVLAAFALNYLWHSRPTALSPNGAGTKTSEPTQ